MSGLEFVDFNTSSGTWIRSRDYIGSWVCFIAQSIEERTNSFTGEPQTVAVVKFVDLSGDDNSVQDNVRLSDRWIVEKLKDRIGKAAVGKITRAKPKQKGYQGAIIIDPEPDAEEFNKAVAKAKSLLNGGAPKPEPEPVKDDLDDLLGEFSG